MKKKIAVVTGASSGMGKDFVTELLKDHSIDEIWMIARREELLSAMAKTNPDKLRSLPYDLTRVSSFYELEDLFKKTDVSIRYLVNAAGMGYRGETENISMDEHCRMIDLNVRAFTCMTRICLPYFQKHSHILQLCSSSAFMPQPGFASYAASKAYTLSFSRALNRELKKRHIYVTAVCPGPVNTAFFSAAGQEIHPSKKNFMADSESVVQQALKDAKAKKSLSIYGNSMKLVRIAGKVIPTEILLFFSEKFLNN